MMLKLLLFVLLGTIAHLLTKLSEQGPVDGFQLKTFFHGRLPVLISNLVLSFITVIVAMDAPAGVIEVTPFNSFLIGYSYNSFLSNFTQAYKNRK